MVPENHFFGWFNKISTQKWNWILKSFFLVRCEDSIPGESSKGSSFNYINKVRNQVGSYQDDKDILTTGLVFEAKMLESYTKAGYFIDDWFTSGLFYSLPVFLLEPSDSVDSKSRVEIVNLKSNHERVSSSSKVSMNSKEVENISR